MTLQIRIFLTGVLSVLVSAGLIGCAVFTASASHAHAAHSAPVTVEAAMSPHHAGHGNHDHHGQPQTDGDHHLPKNHSECEGCARTLLNRAATKIDAGMQPDQLPAPVLVVPAAYLFVKSPAGAIRAVWPPGDEPPIRPATLTHQKISLLI